MYRFGCAQVWVFVPLFVGLCRGFGANMRVDLVRSLIYAHCLIDFSLEFAVFAWHSAPSHGI